MVLFPDNDSAPLFDEEPIPDDKQSPDSNPMTHQADESQQNFVSYMEQVFSALGISGRFEVIDVKNNSVPSWVESSQATNEFIVAAACTGFKKKIERFLSRPVFEQDGIIYWFDGEPLGKRFERVQIHVPEPIERPESGLKQNQLKSSTRLPSWLDHFIFEELKGRWDADHEKFESNLRSSQDDNLVYLGTYFPRSYADSFCIFDNLFSVDSCHSSLEHKETLRILSVGCGTGGDIIGLLTALLRNFTHFHDISVYAIDGNPYALSIIESIFDRFCITTRCNAHLYVKQAVIDSFSTDCLSDWPSQKFDFIVSSKMIGEIISGGNGTKDNAYYDFGKSFLPKLTASGLCLILDVTTKPLHTSLFFPHMMSEQLNRLLREEEGYEVLVPICCSHFGKICQNLRCFQQKEFSISHSRKSSDKCRVAYHLIARKKFVQSLGIVFPGKRMSVYEGAVCPYTDAFEGDVDPYQLDGYNRLV